MAIDKLTDRVLATGVTLNDLIHIIDVDDLSQNPAGSSYKATINQVKTTLSGPFGIPDSNGVYTFYNTLNAAVSAASSGQTVEVFADYNTSIDSIVNLKDGVNINFNGHTYVYSPAASVPSFTDNGVPVKCSLLNGTIRRAVASLSICVLLTSASTITTTCIFDSNYQTIRADNPLSVIDGGIHYSVTGPTGLGVITSNGTVRNVFIDRTTPFTLTNGSYCLYLGSGATASNCQIVSRTNQALHWGVYLSESATISNSTVSTGGVNVLIAPNPFTKIYNCRFTTSSAASGDAVQISSSGIITNSTIISSTTNALTIGGNVRVNNCYINALVGRGLNITSDSFINNTSIFASSNESVLFNTGGTGNIESCVIRSSTSPSINIIQTTPADRNQFTLLNSRIFSNSNVGITSTSPRQIFMSNCTIETLWNNVGGHCITLPANIQNHRIHNCQLITTNASAFGINSGINAGVHYVNNSFEGMNTSVSANVTQQAVGIQTAQQNILIT